MARSCQRGPRMRSSSGSRSRPKKTARRSGAGCARTGAPVRISRPGRRADLGPVCAAPVHPPTYPVPRRKWDREDERRAKYAINEIGNGVLICELDTAQSQANRMQASCGAPICIFVDYIIINEFQFDLTCTSRKAHPNLASDEFGEEMSRCAADDVRNPSRLSGGCRRSLHGEGPYCELTRRTGEPGTAPPGKHTMGGSAVRPAPGRGDATGSPWVMKRGPGKAFAQCGLSRSCARSRW